MPTFRGNTELSLCLVVVTSFVAVLAGLPAISVWLAIACVVALVSSVYFLVKKMYRVNVTRSSLRLNMTPPYSQKEGSRDFDSTLVEDKTSSGTFRPVQQDLDFTTVHGASGLMERSPIWRMNSLSQKLAYESPATSIGSSASLMKRRPTGRTVDLDREATARAAFERLQQPSTYEMAQRAASSSLDGSLVSAATRNVRAASTASPVVVCVAPPRPVQRTQKQVVQNPASPDVVVSALRQSRKRPPPSEESPDVLKKKRYSRVELPSKSVDSSKSGFKRPAEGDSANGDAKKVRRPNCPSTTSPRVTRASKRAADQADQPEKKLQKRRVPSRESPAQHTRSHRHSRVLRLEDDDVLMVDADMSPDRSKERKLSESQEGSKSGKHRPDSKTQTVRHEQSPAKQASSKKSSQKKTLSKEELAEIAEYKRKEEAAKALKKKLTTVFPSNTGGIRRSHPVFTATADTDTEVDTVSDAGPTLEDVSEDRQAAQERVDYLLAYDSDKEDIEEEPADRKLRPVATAVVSSASSSVGSSGLTLTTGTPASSLTDSVPGPLSLSSGAGESAASTAQSTAPTSAVLSTSLSIGGAGLATLSASSSSTLLTGQASNKLTVPATTAEASSAGALSTSLGGRASDVTAVALPGQLSSQLGTASQVGTAHTGSLAGFSLSSSVKLVGSMPANTSASSRNPAPTSSVSSSSGLSLGSFQLTSQATLATTSTTTTSSSATASLSSSLFAGAALQGGSGPSLSSSSTGSLPAGQSLLAQGGSAIDQALQSQGMPALGEGQGGAGIKQASHPQIGSGLGLTLQSRGADLGQAPQPQGGSSLGGLSFLPSSTATTAESGKASAGAFQFGNASLTVSTAPTAASASLSFQSASKTSDSVGLQLSQPAAGLASSVQFGQSTLSSAETNNAPGSQFQFCPTAPTTNTSTTAGRLLNLGQAGGNQAADAKQSASSFTPFSGLKNASSAANTFQVPAMAANSNKEAGFLSTPSSTSGAAPAGTSPDGMDTGVGGDTAPNQSGTSTGFSFSSGNANQPAPFGGTFGATQNSQSKPAGMFSFGSQNKQPSTTMSVGTSAASQVAPSFNFSVPAQSTSNSKQSFSFGSPAGGMSGQSAPFNFSKAGATSSKAGGGFVFGNSSSNSQPAQQGFSFGSTAAEGPGANPTQSSFNFSAGTVPSSSSNPTKSSFNFSAGTVPSLSSNPTQSSFNFSASTVPSSSSSTLFGSSTFQSSGVPASQQQGTPNSFALGSGTSSEGGRRRTARRRLKNNH